MRFEAMIEINFVLRTYISPLHSTARVPHALPARPYALNTSQRLPVTITANQQVSMIPR